MIVYVVVYYWFAFCVVFGCVLVLFWLGLCGLIWVFCMVVIDLRLIVVCRGFVRLIVLWVGVNLLVLCFRW